VYGTGTAAEFGELVQEYAASVGLTIKESKPSSGQSDDASFYNAGVPAMHFFTGMHPDYHRPSDDTDKINEQDAVRILNLVYDIAVEVINAEARPTFADTSQYAALRPGGNRVVMGIYPGNSAGGESRPGLLVERIVTGGAADKAGMKSGDRIVRISETKVGQIEDYMEAIRSSKAGDEVTVVVGRGDQEVTLTVTLESG
jgi:C-terminal processing protease CtpA/Prc